MKYRVDLSAHTSIVVDAEDEWDAGTIAEQIINDAPNLYAYFEVDDGGVEEFEEKNDN